MGSNHEDAVRANHSSAALTVACLALATDALVYGMAVPVLPKIAAQHGARPLGIGLMFAVYAGALVAAAPVAGRWVDRQGNRRPLLSGVAGLGLATLLFAFARDPGLLILGRALQGAAAGVVWTAALALVAATHAPQERGVAMGKALASFAIGALIGPPLGGLLAGWFGPRVPFLVAFGLAIVDGVARWMLVPRGTGTEPRGTISDVRHQPGIPLVVILTATGAALIAYLEPILPLHLFTTENTSSGAVGLIFGLAALAGAVATPLAGSMLRKVAPEPLAVVGCLMAAAGLLALGGALHGVVPVGAGLAVVVFGASMVLTPTVTVMSQIAEARQPPAYGSVYALYTLAYTGGLAAAPLGAGLAMQGLGFGGATRVAAGVAVLVAVTLTLAARKRRPVPAPDHAELRAETRRST
jgi:predicted MFS family arabinose efflux permease